MSKQSFHSNGSSLRIVDNLSRPSSVLEDPLKVVVQLDTKAREEVAVAVHRCHDRRVAEAGLDFLRMRALSDQDRRACVAKVMES